MTSTRPTLSVTQLNEYLKALIDSDRVVSGVYVRGEISNFKLQMPSGHMYFTLKDEGSAIRAVMFRSSAARLKFRPENGMKVIAMGRVSVYVRDGQYQLYVDSLVPDGAGDLAVRFEQLKAKLEAEGFFDPLKKKDIPRYPDTVGIITSPTGAAVRDIINVCTRRFPHAKLVLFPVLVQGDGAAESMIQALDFFSLSEYADVIIIGRGGGSIEDLWAFNDEMLARAIFRCNVPIISAVGHETDFTICDFVADRRAPTPSAAAEIAVPDSVELIVKFDNLRARLKTLLTTNLESKKKQLSLLEGSFIFREPLRMLDAKYLLTDNLSRELDQAEKNLFDKKSAEFANALSKLEMLNPLAVLSRGYSVLYNSDNRIINSVNNAETGETVKIELSDGNIYSEIKEVERRPVKNGKRRKDKL